MFVEHDQMSAVGRSLGPRTAAARPLARLLAAPRQMLQPDATRYCRICLSTPCPLWICWALPCCSTPHGRGAAVGCRIYVVVLTEITSSPTAEAHVPTVSPRVRLAARGVGGGHRLAFSRACAA